MQNDKKTLLWIGGGIVAGLLALGVVSAAKPSEFSAIISNIQIQ